MQCQYYIVTVVAVIADIAIAGNTDEDAVVVDVDRWFEQLTLYNGADVGLADLDTDCIPTYDVIIVTITAIVIIDADFIVVVVCTAHELVRFTSVNQ